MGVDLGSEFTKIAVVSPGIHMDIALDGTSDRKVPTIIYLKRDVRLFGNAAVSSAIRDPTSTFESLPSILGKKIGHPDVNSYQQRFFYHNLTSNEENGLLAFNIDGQLITVEELLAMFLEYVRTVAQDYSSSKMNSLVLTVPAYYTQAQRRALIRTGNLAGLDVKELINDVSAVALNYGLFRRNTFDKTPRNYLFFDVGASATVAAVVSYQVAPSRDGQLMVQSPHAFIRGVGADPTLGTNVFIDHLLHHLIEKFKATKNKPSLDFKRSPRVWKRLLSETKKIFKILSANTDVHFTLEDLIDNEDFSLKVTRRELEEICLNLTANIANPVLTALNSSSIPISAIDEVILFGGGSRVPMIQDALKRVIGKSVLGKGINADEAAAMGAVFQSARLTAGFRVPPFHLKDFNFYQIQVTFPRAAQENDSDGLLEHSNASRTLFPVGVLYPQGRSITFKKVQSQFTILVHYGDTVDYLDGDMNLMNITIHDAFEKSETFSNFIPRGVKAHFAIDASGLLNITEVNLILEPKNDTEISSDGDSTFKKLTDGISSLFGGTDSPVSTDSDSPLNVSESSKAPSPSDRTESPTSNTTAAPTTSTAKKQSLQEGLRFDVEMVDALTPSSEHIASSIKLLRQLESADNDRRYRERIQNKLESSIYEYRNMLHSEPHNKYCSSSQQESIENVLMSVSEWYEENGDTANSKELEEHLEKVDGSVYSLIRRVDGFKNVTSSLDKLSNFMKEVDNMLKIMRMFQIPLNKTSEDGESNTTKPQVDEPENQTSSSSLQVFSKMEVDFFASIVKKVKKWMNNSTLSLETADLTMDPPVAESDVETRMEQMVEQVHFFSTKLENWRAAADAAEFARKAKAAQAAAENVTSKKNVTSNEYAESTETINATRDFSSVNISSPSVNTSDTTPRSDL